MVKEVLACLPGDPGSNPRTGQNPKLIFKLCFVASDARKIGARLVSNFCVPNMNMALIALINTIPRNLVDSLTQWLRYCPVDPAFLVRIQK